MGVVAGALFADECFDVAGETFAEPLRRARAGQQDVGDFVEVGRGAGADAMSGEVDGASAGRGNTTVGADLQDERGAAGTAGEAFDRGDATRGECGEAGGFGSRERGALVAHDSSPATGNSERRRLFFCRRHHEILHAATIAHIRGDLRWRCGSELR